MKKYLNRLDVFSIVVGGIIGWGSFMLPGTKFLKESWSNKYSHRTYTRSIMYYCN